MQLSTSQTMSCDRDISTYVHASEPIATGAAVAIGDPKGRRFLTWRAPERQAAPG
jgi:hypothetical protein